MLGRFCRICATLIVSVSLAACAQTTRVDDAALATGSTARTKKGIALVKVGAAINACTTASVTLGVRDGVKFRDITTLRVVGLNSLTQPAVAEVELDPGEYHVTSYTCLSPRNGPVRVAGAMQLSGKVESIASFSIAAGEIVNTGFLVIEPVRVRRRRWHRRARMADLGARLADRGDQPVQDFSARSSMPRCRHG